MKKIGLEVFDMAELKKITEYLDALLELPKFAGDASNNGLQVEGVENVGKIVFAVDASLALFEAAADADAEMVFVHHGLSWGDGFKRLRGMDAARFAVLFSNGISLYAAHLPLDAHPEIGHNAVLARGLGLSNRVMFAEYAGTEIGVAGELPREHSAAEVAELVKSRLGLTTTLFGDRQDGIKRVGVISGGAGSDGVSAAVEADLDCLITGELGHSSWHVALESGIAVLAGGHYQTEKPGVLSVMEKLASEFDVETEFIDIPTGL